MGAQSTCAGRAVREKPQAPLNGANDCAPAGQSLTAFAFTPPPFDRRCSLDRASPCRSPGTASLLLFAITLRSRNKEGQIPSANQPA